MLRENLISDLIDRRIKIGTYIKIIHPQLNNWIIFQLLDYIEGELVVQSISLKARWLASNMKEYENICSVRSVEEVVVGCGVNSTGDMVFKLTKDDVLIEVL